MRAGAIVACIGLALLVGGCNTTDSNYLRSGVGTEVPADDIAVSTNIQELYFGEVCRQAGLPLVAGPEGAPYCDNVSPAGWSVFVQAGMNDIDRRCDAYLAWLDDRRRWREPAIKQLHSTAAATAAIMGLTGVNATSIAIAGAAFGFAQETFVNLSGRLVTEINQSTVQSLVLNRQNAYRSGISRRPIANRPAALYALRSYLRICMPMTIETEINTTMTGVDATGVAPPPMITPETVTSAIIVSPDVQIGPRQNPPKPKLVSAFIGRVQGALCEPVDGALGTSTRDAIIGYLQARRLTVPQTIDPASTTLRPRLQEVIDEVGSCKDAGFVNVFEVARYGVPEADKEARIKVLQRKMTSMLQNKGSKTVVSQTGAFDKATRDAIGELRGDPSRTFLDSELNRQIQAF